VQTFCRPFNLLHIFLLSFILFNRYEKIHFTCYSGVCFSGSKTRIILTVHDVYYRKVKNYFSSLRIVNILGIIYYDMIVCLSLSSASNVIAISNSTKEDLRTDFGVESHIVRHGVRMSGVNFYEKNLNRKVYLYIGNLRRNKNIDLLLDVFSDLPHEELIIAGYYSSVPYYKVPDNVKFIGYVNDIASLYREAKAFIFPSFYEGFGLPIYEALINGCIVYSSNGGALGEFDLSNVYHFNPYSKEELLHLINFGPKDFVEMGDELKDLSWDNLLIGYRKFL